MHRRQLRIFGGRAAVGARFAEDPRTGHDALGDRAGDDGLPVAEQGGVAFVCQESHFNDHGRGRCLAQDTEV
ncbi:hypothetical protein SDC9_64418 [bioreactor metagenome]|uniref:Uncharacterized protein n=1 Tax=bioreactor metagenome TaxID=1076179 RepID=A0A644XPW0_9ZZZZ